MAANYPLVLLAAETVFSSGLHHAAISSALDFPNRSREAEDHAVNACWTKTSVRIRSCQRGCPLPSIAAAALHP